MQKRKPKVIQTPEFKREAVRLMDESGKPASLIALELGIRRNLLYKWKDQLAAQNSKAALPVKRGRPTKENQSQLATLKQENRRLQEEVEILKKAAAYFAKELK